jgi:hypothetical protein
MGVLVSATTTQRLCAANRRHAALADTFVRLRILTMKTALIVIFFLFMVTTANSVCLYGNPPAIETEFNSSQSVFVGKAVSRSPIPESGKYYGGQNYGVNVQKVFKGNLPKTLTVFSENSSGRFPMIVGKTYIIFVYYDGRHQIDNCGNSGLVSEKEEVVRTLRLLRQTKNGTKK